MMVWWYVQVQVHIVISIDSECYLGYVKKILNLVMIVVSRSNECQGPMSLSLNLVHELAYGLIITLGL